MSDVGRPSTEVYRQSIEKLPRAVWRAQRRAGIQFVLLAAILVTIVTLIPAAEAGDAVDRALVLATLALFASPYFVWRAGRRVRRYWNAFELSIGAESMRVAAKGAGRISIRRDEIGAITEGTDGLDVTSTAGDVAQVPTTVEGYVDARARLAAWSPIRWRVDDRRWGSALLGLAGLLGGLMFVMPTARSFAVPFVILHLTTSARVASELRANPGLSAPRKALSVMVALGSTLLLLASAVVASLR